MPTTSSTKPAKSGSKLPAAKALLKSKQTFEAMLAKMLSAKERQNAQQHLEQLRAEDGARADQWERMACTLFTLAPDFPRFVGQKAMQFSIPDGRYKLQVFALQSGDKGVTHVYCPDVLAEAIEMGAVRAGKAGERPHLVGGTTALVGVDQVVAEAPGEQRVADCVRPMLGWGKKALHVGLTPDMPASLLDATEILCAIAALKWAKKE